MKSVGLATQGLLKGALHGMVDNRQHIIAVTKTNDGLQVDLHRGGKMVQEIQLRELYQKGMLYATIVLLFIAIVLVLLLKIIR